MTAGFRLAECRHSRVETPSHDRTSQFARDSISVGLYKLCCAAKLKRTRLLIKLANSFLCVCRSDILNMARVFHLTVIVLTEILLLFSGSANGRSYQTDDLITIKGKKN
jgi:hypothetical protein